MDERTNTAALIKAAITDMAIAHDMSHTPFCDEGHWRDEFIEAKARAIAAIEQQPQQAATKSNAGVDAGTPTDEEIEEADRKFQYKYFGDYELSSEQMDAVITMHTCMLKFKTLRASLRPPAAGDVSLSATPQDDVVKKVMKAIASVPKYQRLDSPTFRMNYERECALQAIKVVTDAMPRREEVEDNYQGYMADLSELVRVARDNPSNLRDFLMANYPNEMGLSKEQHQKHLATSSPAPVAFSHPDADRNPEFEEWFEKKYLKKPQFDSEGFYTGMTANVSNGWEGALARRPVPDSVPLVKELRDALITASRFYAKKSNPPTPAYLVEAIADADKFLKEQGA